MIGLDTETTGTDFPHGALPFLVTICYDDYSQDCYEWDVDPYTRKPIIPKDDIEEIRELVTENDLVLHNAKFDATALSWVDNWYFKNWPWKRTYDTLIASHLLDSSPPHNLTDTVIKYLSSKQNPINIEEYEIRLESACVKARRLCRKLLPKWAIAKHGRKDMPSLKKSSKAKEDRAWKADTWLLKALVAELGHDKLADEIDGYERNWDRLTKKYANADSAVTRMLWPTMKQIMVESDLWSIFESRMKLIPIAFKMEHRGVSLSRKRLEKLQDEYKKESIRAGKTCINIASEFKKPDGTPCVLTLPKSGNNKSLLSFVFDTLKLKSIEDGSRSLDKENVEHFVESLKPNTLEITFLQNLSAKRKADKAIADITGYERFWIPLNVYNDRSEQLWCTLHPNLNCTGTSHLRWSCKNPNSQNLSKREGYNTRFAFGPSDGREWWRMDGKNLELRIPTFEAGETDLMEVFLKPKEAPYYGSYHLVIFDLLHPELFRQFGEECKEKFASTWYQWIKNGNFAVIYGCQKKKADATYHVDGAFEKIRYRFPKIAKLADRQIAEANKTGSIHTIPDRSVNPRKGYPIRCAHGSWGKVKPTIPLNYHVSGTAMQWMNMCMIRCDEQLMDWYEKDNYDGFITMQVHDELVFDLPKRTHPIDNPERSNLDRIRRLQHLMEIGGEHINVPTPVSVEYTPNTLNKGIKI